MILGILVIWQFAFKEMGILSALSYLYKGNQTELGLYYIMLRR